MRSKTKLKRLIVAGLVLMALLMSITIFLPEISWVRAATTQTIIRENVPAAVEPPVFPELVPIDISGVSITPRLSDSVYEIGTAEQLEWFFVQVNANTGNRYWNAELTADIDLKIKEGANEGKYKSLTICHTYYGTFDGNGKKIINYRRLHAYDDRAMFYTLGGLTDGTIATIKNLTLKDVYITDDGDSSSSRDMAVLSFFVSNNGVVYNCKIEGDSWAVGKSPRSSIGGIVGMIYNTPAGSNMTISNCESNINIRTACANTGEIRGHGGILGMVSTYARGTLNVDGCKFTGTIDVRDSVNQSGTNPGGIMGAVDDHLSIDLAINITNCINEGTIIFDQVDADNIAGGIVGNYTSRAGLTGGIKTLNITGCENKGNIITAPIEGGYTTQVGGIIGRLHINSTSANFGAVAKVNIANCENYGQIGMPDTKPTSGGFAGGISGGIRINGNQIEVTDPGDSQNTTKIRSSVSITGCTNEGVIYGSSCTGGILAFFCNYTVKNTSYFDFSMDDNVNKGDVGLTGSGSSGSIGGILGHVNISSANAISPDGIDTWSISTRINNCRNFGNITGNYYLGGILGQYTTAAAISTSVAAFTSYSETLEIKNCSNDGDVMAPSTSIGSVGGIAGYITGTLAHAGIDSTNIDSVTRDFIISQNYNRGDIFSNYWYAGGIVGFFSVGAGSSTDRGGYFNFELTKNYNTGNIVSAGMCTGGIIGQSYCSVANAVSKSIKTITDNFSTAARLSASNCIGGIAGSVSYIDGGWNSTKDVLVFSRNYSTTTDITGTNASGLVGQVFNTGVSPASTFTFKDCYTAYSNICANIVSNVVLETPGTVTGLDVKRDMVGANAFAKMPGLNAYDAFETSAQTPQLKAIATRSYQKSRIYFDYTHCYGEYENESSADFVAKHGTDAPDYIEIDYDTAIPTLPALKIQDFPQIWHSNETEYKTTNTFLEPMSLVVSPRWLVEITYNEKL